MLVLWLCCGDTLTVLLYYYGDTVLLLWWYNLVHYYRFDCSVSVIDSLGTDKVQYW